MELCIQIARPPEGRPVPSSFLRALACMTSW